MGDAHTKEKKWGCAPFFIFGSVATKRILFNLTIDLSSELYTLSRTITLIYTFQVQNFRLQRSKYRFLLGLGVAVDLGVVVGVGIAVGVGVASCDEDTACYTYSYTYSHTFSTLLN